MCLNDIAEDMILRYNEDQYKLDRAIAEVAFRLTDAKETAKNSEAELRKLADETREIRHKAIDNLKAQGLWFPG